MSKIKEGEFEAQEILQIQEFLHHSNRQIRSQVIEFIDILENCSTITQIDYAGGLEASLRIFEKEDENSNEEIVFERSRKFVMKICLNTELREELLIG